MTSGPDKREPDLDDFLALSMNLSEALEAWCEAMRAYQRDLSRSFISSNSLRMRPN